LTNYSTFKNYITSYLKKELAGDLYYHGFHHTMDVYDYVVEIAKAEKINRKDLTLLKVAVLLHDAGFTQAYTGHEDVSCEMAKTLLPQFNYTQDEIDEVNGMIQATKIPQNPKSILEKILADADLLYLGTTRFKEVGDTLFREMTIYSGLKNENEWNRIQKEFLEKHHYHTDYCRKVYEPVKQKNLKKIEVKLRKDH